MSGFRRRLMMAGKALPYDEELMSLESTGTQYIDTGIPISGDKGCYVKMVNIPSSSGDFCFIGTGNDTFRWGLAYWANNSELQTSVIASSVKTSYNAPFYKDTVASGYVWEIYYNYANDKTTIINGSTLRSNMIYGDITTGNIYIFAFNYGGNGTPWRNANMRLYGCQITDNGVVVRDFIPVRVGNEGYLYDKVSGQLFGNAGTGSFILHPRYEYTEIEYIESTGTQYINTGFINTRDTEFYMDFQLTDSTGDRKTIGQGFKFGLGQINGKWRIIDSGWYQTNVNTDTDRHIAYTDNGKYYIDSTVIADRLSNKQKGTYPMLLFAVSSQNSVAPDGDKALMKLYSCKIYNNGNLVRDFIPARIGQVGYLYDRQFGDVFGNVGTGDFILGNDINT